MRLGSRSARSARACPSTGLQCGSPSRLRPAAGRVRPTWRAADYRSRPAHRRDLSTRAAAPPRLRPRTSPNDWAAPARRPNPAEPTSPHRSGSHARASAPTSAVALAGEAWASSSNISSDGCATTLNALTRVEEESPVPPADVLCGPLGCADAHARTPHRPWPSARCPTVSSSKVQLGRIPDDVLSTSVCGVWDP